MPAQSLPPCKWGRASIHFSKIFLDARMRGNDRLGMENQPTPDLVKFALYVTVYGHVNVCLYNLHTAVLLNWLSASGKQRTEPL